MKLFVFLLLESTFSIAQNSVPAIKTDSPPLVDGRINDACWEKSTVVTQFLQREPNEGQAMTEKTEVFICYDSNQIYFGFRCFDDPKKITAKELGRDVSLRYDDRVQIILDTYYPTDSFRK